MKKKQGLKSREEGVGRKKLRAKSRAISRIWQQGVGTKE